MDAATFISQQTLFKEIARNQQRIELLTEIVGSLASKCRGDELACTLCGGETVDIGDEILHEEGCLFSKLEETY